MHSFTSTVANLTCVYIKRKVIDMAFKKVGDAIPIKNVYCPCGGEIDKETHKCLKCGKDFSQTAEKPATTH
jgi:hypothetical protein